jgi:outer membrane protein
MIKKIFTVLTLAIAFLPGLYAQDDLSLNDAITYSLQQNFDIRVEQRNVELAKLNNNWSALFPTLTASIQGSHNVFDNRETLNPFSFLGETTTDQLQPRLNMQWDLFSIANITIGKRQLEQLQAESEGNADIVVSNTIQSVILAYYISVLEKRRLEEFEKQLTLSRDKYDITKVRQELGTAVTSDLLLEEGNYLTDSANYVNQLLRFQNTISNLNFLMAEPNPTRQYNLTDDLVLDTKELSYEELSQEMQQNNVDLKKMYLTQEVLGSTVALRKLDRFPTLSIGGNYNFTRNTQTIDGDIFDQSAGEFRPFRVSGDNENVQWGVNFTISVNLFDKGRINRAIRESLIREEIGQQQLNRMQASLNRDLVQALDQYNIRRSLYEINNRRYESSQQNLEISEEKFKNGTINSFDYRTVQNNNLAAASVRLQSIYDLIDSQITILRLTGGLLQTYK